jgi:indole-3-glycerol phosphate synthase
MSQGGILETICAQKKEEVTRAMARVTLSEVRAQAEARWDRRPFFHALEKPGPRGANIIAEIKRASPSKGSICPDLDPAELARAYEAGGAAALSVLCDGPFFGALPGDLAAARAACGLPALRKDFIVSFYQIYETVAMGADAVLLIVAVLAPRFLRDVLDLCRELRLAALVEVHTEGELDVALDAGAYLIGVNNRDLKTFQVDLAVSERLVPRMGPGQVAVAESGIQSRADVERLLGAGVHNFLVGESLVRAKEPAVMLAGLLGSE